MCHLGLNQASYLLFLSQIKSARHMQHISYIVNQVTRRDGLVLKGQNWRQRYLGSVPHATTDFLCDLR